MLAFKSLTIWTIVLSFLTVIGAGHGIACLGLLEVVGLIHKFEIGTKDFSLSFKESYDKSASAAAFFAFVGHILLVVSVLIKNHKLIFWAKAIGLFFLWVSFYYLTHNFFSDNLSEITFITGLPFLIISAILFFKMAKKKYQSVNE